MRKVLFTLPISTIALAVGCSGTVEPLGASGDVNHVRVCGDPEPGQARCHSHVVVDGHGGGGGGGTPAGYSPSDLQAAYKVTGATVPAGTTVAVIDAYDDPTAASDLAAYRSHFGLPAVPSFTKVNQTGGSTLPKASSSWSQEIALDLDMVSAICPGCSILLVEASSASFADLATAVNTAAATPGVVAITNSYGSTESTSDSTVAPSYNHPGIAITASSGDSGYGVQTPAAFATVTAVGGTSLTKDTSARGWSEKAWSGAGSGCSAYVAMPSWQTATTSCAKRTVADVSAVADPNTGVAVYLTMRGRGAWLQFGGTSVASPIIAAMYALANNTSGITGAGDAYAAMAGSLNDVTTGSNGSCGGTYLCTAEVGYDGPTGLGTPSGAGAF